MNEFLALLLTLVLGLFMVIGAFIVFVTKNNEKFITFSLSLAFGVMAALALLELLPESIEKISTGVSNPYLIVVGGAIAGMVFLNILDLFIPDHDKQKGKKNEEHHLHHIGIVSSIALVLHNMIEGMAVYGGASEKVSLGLLISIGVGLHNIPMGMVITSTFYSNNHNKKRTVLIVLAISLATFVGGLFMFVLTPVILNEFALGILLSITLGMILYIVLFELLGQILHTPYKRISILGILIGILILIISIGLE